MPRVDHTKGLTLRMWKLWILEKYGEEGLEQVLQELPEEEREIYRDKILSSSWYPITPHLHALRATVKTFGKGDLSFLHNFGLETSAMSLSWWAKLFFKLGNPHFIIKRCSRIWGYVHTAGDFLVTDLGENSCTAELRNYPNPDHYYCTVISGWITYAMEYSGAKEFRVVHSRCCDRGDSVCQWQADWR